MANLFKNIFNSLKLTDDDDDDYDEYVNELEEKERKKSERVERVDKVEREPAPRSRSIRNDDDYAESKMEQKRNVAYVPPQEERKAPRAVERQAAPSKLVPLRSNSVQKDFEVCILKPTCFGDCQDICDMLLNGRATIINLEGFDDDISQRIMDFVSGSIYAINGKLHPISNRIFIVSPDKVDISGDYMEMMTQNGVDAPTIKREF